MLGKLLLPDINSLLESGNSKALDDLCSNLAPGDLAEMVEDLPLKNRVEFLEQLPAKRATEVFGYLDIVQQKQLVKNVQRPRMAAIITDMEPDDRTALLEFLPSSVAREMLSFLQPKERFKAQSLLDFPKNSAGRLMTPNFLVIDRNWTVDQVFDFIQLNGEDKETLSALYIVDEKGKLEDDIRIREILLSPRQKHIKDIMNHQFLSLNATKSVEETIQTFKKHDRTALPVVDDEGHLIGIITIDDILRISEKADTEDFHRMGAVQGLQEPYILTPLFGMIKKRVGWLVILFLSEMLTATAMGFFEGEISKAVVLALFIPLIISSGGNSGSQASTLVIRAMALGELTFKDWWKVMRREIMAGLIMGSILGVVGFCRIAIWSMFSNIYGAHWLLVAFTILFSLVGVVAWGTLMGAMLPLLLKRCGADPAASSAPFVATLIDVTGIVIYFNIAMFIMRGTML